jgi:hypothetical protein
VFLGERHRAKDDDITIDIALRQQHFSLSSRSATSTCILNLIMMKFVSATALVVVGAVAFASSSASAFAPATPVALTTRRALRSTPSTQISMVADNAKVCLVTGASRGLGAAIALELGKHGQKVVVNYAGSKDKALEVVDAVIAAGGHAIAVQADCKFNIK